MLRIAYARYFHEDVARQVAWYVEKAGADVARKNAATADKELRLLSEHPNLGKTCRFRHPELAQLRLWVLSRLLFYRLGEGEIDAFRLISGVRNLPCRLREPPEWR